MFRVKPFGYFALLSGLKSLVLVWAGGKSTDTLTEGCAVGT